MVRDFLLLLATFFAASTHAQQVSVARYFGDREAAVSYTFDDGLQDQFTLAYPELKKRGLRATFAIIGSKGGGTIHSSQDRAMGISGSPAMTWDMLRQLATDGHEVSSHGWEHKKVQRLTPEQLRYEVQHNDSIIFQQTGQFPRTYFFPGNSRDSATLAYCMRDRVGCRTFQIAIGAKRDSVWLSHWVEGLIAQKAWGVGMTHGIAMGYDHFPDPKVLWSHFDYIAAMQDCVWVAPFFEVAAYVKERDNVQLTVNTTEQGITVDIHNPLDPRIFTQPLTLLVDCPAVAAQQDGQQLEIVLKGRNTVINGVSPFGGKVLIYKEI